MTESIITTFETLPNEIFLLIFSYLDGYSIYQSFYDLNDRFSRLAYLTAGKCLDLREIDDNEAQKTLRSLDQSQVTALLLLNKYDCEQFDKLLQFSFTSLRVLILESISVFTMHYAISSIIISTRLESLSIRFRPDQCDEKIRELTNRILQICSHNLKSLKYLSLSTNFNEKFLNRDAWVRVGSPRIDDGLSSCEHLHLTTIYMSRLKWIASYVQFVRSLTIIASLNRLTSNYMELSNLHTCKITFIETRFNSLSRFLCSCPNLQRLQLIWASVERDDIDDLLWQNLIEHNLTKLKHFNLRMKTQLLEEFDANDLCTNSFQDASFWKERNTIVTVLHKNMFHEDVEIEVEIEF